MKDNLQSSVCGHSYRDYLLSVIRYPSSVIRCLLSVICYLLSAICMSWPLAADAAQDPTMPSGAMAEAMRGRIGDLSDLAIRALVVGADGEGAALVGTRSFTGAPVRRDSVINQDIEGVNVPLAVESVTAEGVKIKTSGGGEWFLPGGFLQQQDWSQTVDLPRIRIELGSPVEDSIRQTSWILLPQ